MVEAKRNFYKKKTLVDMNFERSEREVKTERGSESSHRRYAANVADPKNAPEMTATYSADRKNGADLANTYSAVAANTWETCGTCANTLGLTPMAIHAYEAAVAHTPLLVTAVCGLSYSLRLHDIQMNETLGSQTSIERINRGLERHPEWLKESAVFKELAECYLLIGLNEQAHQSIQTAVQLAPHDLALWLLLAQTLIRTGARAHAAGALTHCLGLLPNLMSSYTASDIETARAAHAELAAIAAADGNIELLIAELTATLALPPPPLLRIDEHVALWCALLTAKERANDIPAAIAACRQAQVAVGDFPRIIMNHAYLLLLQDGRANAAEAIALLLRIVPENPSENGERSNGGADPNGGATADDPNANGDFLPYYLLGKAYSLIEQPRLAYDSYQVALRRALNLPITWLAVGKLYLELQQLLDALAAYLQALRLQLDERLPGTATAWDGLLCVYERCDDQLMDASDACARLAACFKAMGDAKSASFFDDRAEALARASRKEGPVPPLRDPPDVPAFVLRDLVALLPSERIALIQGEAEPVASPRQAQPQPQQVHQQPQQPQQVQHPAQQVPPPAQAQPPLQNGGSPVPAPGVAGTPGVGTPPVAVGPPQDYRKLPHPMAPMMHPSHVNMQHLPPPGWNGPQPPPGYYYQQPVEGRFQQPGYGYVGFGYQQYPVNNWRR